MNPWPKYFIANEPPTPLPEHRPAFAVDLFRAPLDLPHPIPAGPKPKVSGSATNIEWAVTTDSSGHPRLQDAQHRNIFPAEIQSQLNMHELLAPVRILRARPIFLFDLDFIDHGANAP